MKIVIFACVHNAGRSQMAAALFNKYADPKKAKAISAGTQPADKVHPEVLVIMKGVGIDLSNSKPTLLTQELAEKANLLITMGCGENCPYVPGLARMDWPLEDPKGSGVEKAREIRMKIDSLIRKLLNSLSVV